MNLHRWVPYSKNPFNPYDDTDTTWWRCACGAWAESPEPQLGEECPADPLFPSDAA